MSSESGWLIDWLVGWSVGWLVGSLLAAVPVRIEHIIIQRSKTSDPSLLSDIMALKLACLISEQNVFGSFIQEIHNL